MILILIFYVFSFIFKLLISTAIIKLLDSQITILQSSIFLLIVFLLTRIVYTSLERYIYKKNFELVRIRLYSLVLTVVVMLLNVMYMNLTIQTLICLVVFNILWTYIPNFLIKKVEERAKRIP